MCKMPIYRLGSVFRTSQPGEISLLETYIAAVESQEQLLMYQPPSCHSGTVFPCPETVMKHSRWLWTTQTQGHSRRCDAVHPRTFHRDICSMDTYKHLGAEDNHS